MLAVGAMAVPAHGGKGGLACIPPRPPWWRYLPSIQARSDGKVSAVLSSSEVFSVSEKWRRKMDSLISMAARLHVLKLEEAQTEQRVELGLESPKALLGIRAERAELLYKMKAQVELEPNQAVRAYIKCLIGQFGRGAKPNVSLQGAERMDTTPTGN